MPPIAASPEVRLLEAALATLRALDAAGWEEQTGVANLTWRHFRDRYATGSEMPCGALRWISSEEPDAGDQYKTAGERVLRGNWQIMVDLKRPPENRNFDPTGWIFHGRVIALAVNLLRDEATSLIYPAMCDWISDGDIAPDEDSKPDEARLVKDISVVYRVRSDDPNVLLALGENG